MFSGAQVLYNKYFCEKLTILFTDGIITGGNASGKNRMPKNNSKGNGG